MSAPASRVAPAVPRVYRYMQRHVRRMPNDLRPYYFSYVQGQFRSHADETDPEQRVFLLRRGLEKFEWVLEKYSVPRLGPSPPLGPA